MRSHSLVLVIASLILPISARAQDELLNELDQQTTPTVAYTYATFKSTRVVTLHSVENMQAKQLDFRISHRFGRINEGFPQFFGLDQSTIRLGLEYGLTDWLMAGIGRSSYEKTFDGFLKMKLLRQSSGSKNVPVTVSLLSSLTVNGMKDPIPGETYYFSNRLAYAFQMLVARKFTENFSLQLSPSFVHRNLVKTALDPNDLFSLGSGFRYKITKRISFNAEYYYVLQPFWNLKDFSNVNPFSIGFDIETGGHVFQLHLTNALGMTEKAYLGQTTGHWKHGDIHFGFNISRVFSFKK